MRGILVQSLVSRGMPFGEALSVASRVRDRIADRGRVTLEELVLAARFYFDRTGREVTLEYILLGGVNDQPTHARHLAALAKRMRCNVNLIPYNPVPSLPYVRPGDEDQKAFLQRLRAQGVNTHLRPSRGLDVDAACGQLRRRTQK